MRDAWTSSPLAAAPGSQGGLHPLTSLASPRVGESLARPVGADDG